MGHPLRGKRLRVDPAGGLSRRDGRIQVVLPDGSTSLVPVTWTNRGTPTSAGKDGRSTTMLTLLTREGVRRLLRLIDAIASKDGEAPRAP